MFNRKEGKGRRVGNNCTWENRFFIWPSWMVKVGPWIGWFLQTRRLGWRSCQASQAKLPSDAPVNRCSPPRDGWIPSVEADHSEYKTRRRLKRRSGGVAASWEERLRSCYLVSILFTSSSSFSLPQYSISFTTIVQFLRSDVWRLRTFRRTMM